MGRQMPAGAINWDDMRYFLVMAREGSLLGAARVLQTTQPTMGRRLDGFEARLGTRLFRRTPTGLIMTEAGQAVLDHAVRMDEAAAAATLVAGGRDQSLSGSVRITAPEWYGARILAPLLGAFSRGYPDITVELLTDARPLSLTQREADLALRFRRFEQDRLLQRKVDDVPFGLYAAPEYLHRNGAPDFEQEGRGTALIIMNEALGDRVTEAAWLRETLGQADIAFRSNSREAQAAVAATGAGIACLALPLGDAWPGLVQIETPHPIPPREVWLGVHPDLRAVPRIRVLADFLADGLRGAA